MTKHRDFTINRDDYWFGFEACHDSYEAEHDADVTWRGSHPVFHGKDIQDCIQQIDDWYGEQDGN